MGSSEAVSKKTFGQYRRCIQDKHLTMGKGIPSGKKGAKNYDQDYDPEFSYHAEWKGLIYDEEDETKMQSVMNTSMDAQATVFATKSTYLYYTRYYDMLNKMDELRRAATLANINRAVNSEDPMQFRQKRTAGSIYVGPVNTVFGVGALAGMLYALRMLK